MKKLKLIVVLLISISFNFCSSNDETEPVIDTTNGFVFNGDFFSVDNAFIKDDNIVDNTPANISIVLSNVDILSENPKSGGVNYFHFAIEATTVVTGTISPVSIYTLRENTNYNDLLITDGNTILGHDDARIKNRAVSSSITIHSITTNEIDLDFKFTREDGKIITGNYSGNYTNINN